MQMFYNSDNFAVVQFDVPGTTEGDAPPAPRQPQPRAASETAGKCARKAGVVQAPLAETFKQGVQALIETDPSEEEMDAYIERYAAMSQQPLVLH